MALAVDQGDVFLAHLILGLVHGLHALPGLGLGLQPQLIRAAHLLHHQYQDQQRGVDPVEPPLRHLADPDAQEVHHSHDQTVERQRLEHGGGIVPVPADPPHEEKVHKEAHQRQADPYRDFRVPPAVRPQKMIKNQAQAVVEVLGHVGEHHAVGRFPGRGVRHQAQARAQCREGQKEVQRKEVLGSIPSDGQQLKKVQIQEDDARQHQGCQRQKQIPPGFLFEGQEKKDGSQRNLLRKAGEIAQQQLLCHRHAFHQKPASR